MKLRRLLAVVLVWLVVVPVVVLGPARTASAESSTTAVAVLFGERLSGGSSLAVGHVGLRLAFSDLPAFCDLEVFQHEDVCNPDREPSTPPPPPPAPPEPVTPEPTPTPDYAQLKADAYNDAFDDLVDDIPRPRMRLWPAADKLQIVNLDSYLYVESGWSNISGEGEACDYWTPSECVTVWFDGEPEASLWSFVEDNSVNPSVEFECERGERQPDDTDTTPACGKTWTNSSDVTGAVQTEMSVRYDVTVTTTHSAYSPHLNIGFELESPSPDKTTLSVGEVQTYGHSDAAPVTEESNDGLCSKWGISFICWVGDKAKDAAIWALVNTVPGLEQVWDFLKGCGDAVIEELGGILSILETVAGAIGDPEAFINDQLQAMQDLYNAAFDDTEAFIAEVVSGLFDLDYLDEQGAAQWLGKTACSIAIQYLTASAGAKVADLVNDYLGNRRPGNNRPNDRDDDNDDNDDNDGTVCTNRSSSFPTGTHVRMANGVLTPIEDIEPGDYVLAGDPRTDQWSPQQVLRQWSYVDTDNMTTAVLSDGSEITATDHHLFWVEDDQAWIELEHTKPGDHLLTPAGLVDIAQVTTHPQTNTLVWELDTAGPDTFTVRAGNHDVLVHNEDTGGCGSPGSDAHRESQWEQARESGMTRAEFDQRYDELGLNIDKIPDGGEIVSFDPVTGQPVVYKGPDGRYVDIRTPEQLQVRGREIVGDAGDRPIALGRQADTELAPGNGEFHLAVDDWSQELNDAFLDDIIANDVPFRVVSDPTDPNNLFNDLGLPTERPTVFNLELQQLQDAGIDIVYDPYG